MLLGVMALLTAIIIIITLVRMKFKLGFVMLSGAIIIAVFGRLHPINFANIVLHSVISIETVRVVLVIIGITALGHLLKATGNLDDIIDSLKAVISDIRILLVIIPALMGLMAVPGGAIMSAPLIEKMGDELGLDRASLTTINVVFRHICTYLYPICAGYILITSMTNISAIKFIKFNIPVLVLTMTMTFKYIFHSIKPTRTEKIKPNPRTIIKLVFNFSPFIIILLSALVFKVNFALAILIGILYVMFLTKREPNYADSIKNRMLISIKGIKWDIVLAIVGIMIFKDIVSVTGFLDEISLYLVRTGTPLFVLAIMFPLIAGFITGNNSAAIGLTVPLFLQIIPQGVNPVPYYNLIYVSTVTGHIFSPFHPCLILTAEYYNTSLNNVLKQVTIICSWIIVAALIEFMIIA